MCIMKVHDTFPCENRLNNEQDVSYKLCVHNLFCEKLLAEHHPYTMVSRS
jgi:hypothetical protein